MPITVRTMTPLEFDEWRRTMARHYAQRQIQLGRWVVPDAEDRALRGITMQLPEGLDTPRMLLLTATDEHSTPVGRAWVGLDHPDRIPNTSYLHDIEIDTSRRGNGLGRALLAAVEATAAEAGVAHLELHVFTDNGAAMSLYATNDYRTTEQTMRKALDPA